VTTTDDRLRDITAGSAGPLTPDTAILLGDGHKSAQGSVEEPKDGSHSNDILAGERLNGAPSYAVCEIDFRGHHQMNAARRQGSYEIYRLVYRYGFDLGVDPRYRTADWAIVEQDARPRWEERNPGTWEEFQDTIRFAWDTARK
jgi:hypothetical protein